MNNLQKFNDYYSAGYSVESGGDVFSSDDWSACMQWIVDSKGRRVKHTEVYALYYRDSFNSLHADIKDVKRAIRGM